jgi:hypothetical protein
MAAYRKTELIEAVQFNAPGDHPAVYRDESSATGYSVMTREGRVDVAFGYWIATGVEGEHWPIDPDVFAKTYERV